VSVIAAAVQLMLSEGIPHDKIVEAIGRMEAETIRIARQSAFEAADQMDHRSPGAKRMQRYREHRKNSGLSVGFDSKQFVPQLRKRDGVQCVYCEEAPGTVVEHMVPISDGGTDDLNNLALACAPCNCGKAGRWPGGKYEIKNERTRSAHVRYVRERSLAPPSLDNKGLPHTPSKQLNPSKENPPKGGQKKGNDYPSDAFDRWYALYPRKQARGTAEQAFAKVRRDGQVTFTALMAGTERYRANPPNDPKFIPLPATWLNAGRWADEPHAEGSNGAKTHNLNDAAAALHERLLAAELQDRTLPAELRGGAIEGDAWFVPAK
jgi:hypothetical protein